METIGFTIFCLFVAGVVYWSLIYDDRLSEEDEGLVPSPSQSDEEGSSDS